VSRETQRTFDLPDAVAKKIAVFHSAEHNEDVEAAPLAGAKQCAS